MYVIVMLLCFYNALKLSGCLCCNLVHIVNTSALIRYEVVWYSKHMYSFVEYWQLSFNELTSSDNSVPHISRSLVHMLTWNIYSDLQRNPCSGSTVHPHRNHPRLQLAVCLSAFIKAHRLSEPVQLEVPHGMHSTWNIDNNCRLWRRLISPLPELPTWPFITRIQNFRDGTRSHILLRIRPPP